MSGKQVLACLASVVSLGMLVDGGINTAALLASDASASARPVATVADGGLGSVTGGNPVSASPEPSPSDLPSPSPSPSPLVSPVAPSPSPSPAAVVAPVAQPTVKPTAAPTAKPTAKPAPAPSPVPAPKPTPKPAPSPTPVAVKARADSAMLSYINADRAAGGVAPLAWDSCLANAAISVAQTMANNKTMAHGNGLSLDFACHPGPTGENLAEYNSRTENLAWCNSAWMGSAGHKANIMDASFGHMGFAFAVGANGVGYYALELSA